MAARPRPSTNTAENARVRNARLPALAIAGALALIAWELLAASHIHALFGDFRAFYCASSALAHGANPYAASSIYACERPPMPLGLYRALHGVAVPAPLPGYALLAFVPFALAPYVVSCALWLLVILAAGYASARALAFLLDLPLGAAIWALAAGFAVVCIPFGELGSIIVAAVLWMAVALRRGGWTQAALCAAVAMILPHVAIPAFAGVALSIPRMRLRLLAAAIVLFGLDLACGGPGAALAYVRDVLPAHARSEIGSTAQYGLTWVLHGLHASDRVAILGGEVSYACMTLLGLLAAHAFYKRSNDPAYAALIPPAFAVLGGTFMHYTQIMIAIPAALLLVQQAAPRSRVLFGAALLLLVVPWAWVLGQPALIAVFAVVCGGVAAALLRCSGTASLRVALAAALLGAVIIVAGARFGPGLNPHVHAIALKGGLAQSSWAIFNREQRASTAAIWWIAKAPTWLGLLLLALGCAHVLVKEDLVPPVVIEQMPVAP